MTDNPGRGETPHLPVLYHEIIHFLRPQRSGLYVDCTVGAGGHAWGLLDASHPDGQLLGLDVDPWALDLAREHLAEYGSRVHLAQNSYTSLKDQLARLGWETVDGVLLDLGVSSMQLADSGRGFSFQRNGPLDMRFDPTATVRADDLINDLPEQELADLLYTFGEERKSRQIAKAIVQARPIHTTKQLTEVVLRVTPKRGRRHHPATKTFQALRIAVNQELTRLSVVLPQALGALTVGGRLAVISFHSLEDRMVKRFFREESMDCHCPPEQTICNCGHTAAIAQLTSKPIRPSADELRQNPRARSARLRVAEKIVP